MRFQRFQAEVIFYDLVVVISFCNEQVGVARRRDQRLRPFGIGAVGDDAAFGLDPVGQERTAGQAVYHRKRCHFHRAECLRLPRLERNDRKIEPLLCFRRMLEQRFHDLRQPGFDSLGSGDDKRTGPAGELRVEQ